MKTYSDEYLDHWGDVYVANYALFTARNVLFETFLLDPWAILTAVTFGFPLPSGEDGFYPLLPAQKAIQERLINEEADQEMVDYQRRVREAMRHAISLQMEQLTTMGPSPVRCRNGLFIEPLHHKASPDRRGRRCAFKPSDS